MSEERKQVGARLPKDFVAKISKLAIDRDISLNDIIEDVLIDWYNKQPESNTYGKAASTSATTATQEAAPKKSPAAKGAATPDPQKAAKKSAAKRRSS